MSLLDLIAQTHFLRVLLTDPESVIPPGKSLLSVLTDTNFNKETEAPILHTVTQVAHRAFWSEVGTATNVQSDSNIYIYIYIIY